MNVEATETNAALTRFQQMAGAWLQYIQWVSIVAVGVKLGNGLQLISGRVHFYRIAVPEPDVLVETDHIVARRRLIACTPDTASRLLDDAVFRGIVSFPKEGASFELRSATRGVNAYPIRPPGFAADVRVPTCRVTGDRKFAGLEPIGGLDAVDWELRGFREPYYGLDEVMVSLGLPTTTAMGDLAQLEVLIAPPAVIAGDISAIRDHRASVRILASPKLRDEDISVACKALSTERIRPARSLEFVKRERAEGPGDDVLHFDGDVGDDTAVRVFLIVDAIAVNQFWIVDASRRLHAGLASVEPFDDSLNVLDQNLFATRGDQAERFEWAVGALLYLLGFRALRLGKGTPITDGPDLLALTPSGHVAVVECTIGHPDNKDKVAKVIQRAARVRERLNKSGFSTNMVLPVVVTPLPRVELKDASADALRRGVVVLDGESLKDLRQRANFQQNPDELLKQAMSALPAG